MTREVKGRFSGGVIELLEPVELEEGEEVVVIVKESPKGKKALETLRASRGGWKGMHDPEELKRMIYAARIRNSRPMSDP